MRFIRLVTVFRNILARLVFLPFSKSYVRAFEYNKFRQGGLCRLCKTKIEYGEMIVSKGYNNTKYYHASCAQNIMIV
jgi:hypothetical protein